jgi:hypothetical protein
MADLFCVQWDEQQKYYRDALNIGPVL